MNPQARHRDQGARRAAVLDAVRDAGAPARVADLAQRIGVHDNTVRFHLKQLIEDGYVESVQTPPDGIGRPVLRYRAVAAMDPAGPRNYLALAQILLQRLARHPDARGEALESGRSWGAALAGQNPAPRDSATGLADLLTSLGFDAALPSPDELHLHHCPFLELAHDRQDLICPIHLGLMRGALEGWSAPYTITHLEPFAKPDVCIARLAAQGAAA